MSESDLDRLLNTPIHAFDFQSMIGDVKDFLDFSEANIDWQGRRELRSVPEKQEFREEPELRDHLFQVAEHRFGVSLPLQVRYAALISFVTSVEWALIYIDPSTRKGLEAKKDGVNLNVRILRDLSTRTQFESHGLIEDFEALVKVRNCIVHAGCIVSAYKFQAELVEAIARLPGFTIESQHFFGPQVSIARGALDTPLERTKEFVVEIHRRIHEKRADGAT